VRSEGTKSDVETTAPSSAAQSTIDALGTSGRRVQRWLYLATTGVLAALVGVAVTDALGLTSAYGVRSEERRDHGGGYGLEVRYPAVTRPGLASPFRIEVSSGSGFSQPVTVAVDRSYLAMWDENGLSPAPTSELVNGPWVEWEFDPPVGDVLSVTFDARIEPAVQSSRDGAVRLIVGDQSVAEVDFRTRVMP